MLTKAEALAAARRAWNWPKGQSELFIRNEKRSVSAQDTEELIEADPSLLSRG